MSKKKYCYKVVQDDLTSCSKYIIAGRPQSIQYIIGQFVSPKIPHSKLFCFNTLKNALRFSRGYDIYKCEVINPEPINQMCLSIGLDTQFWYEKHTQIEFSEYMSEAIGVSPKGTIGADQIKLIEKVYPTIKE